jgi:hypothetical protein
VALAAKEAVMKRGLLSKLSVAGGIALAYAGASAAPVGNPNVTRHPVTAPRVVAAAPAPACAGGNGPALQRLVGHLENQGAGWVRTLDIGSDGSFALQATTDPGGGDQSELAPAGSPRVRRGTACVTPDGGRLILTESGYTWSMRLNIRPGDGITMVAVWDRSSCDDGATANCRPPSTHQETYTDDTGTQTVDVVDPGEDEVGPEMTFAQS